MSSNDLCKKPVNVVLVSFLFRNMFSKTNHLDLRYSGEQKDSWIFLLQAMLNWISKDAIYIIQISNFVWKEAVILQTTPICKFQEECSRILNSTLNIISGTSANEIWSWYRNWSCDSHSIKTIIYNLWVQQVSLMT